MSEWDLSEGLPGTEWQHPVRGLEWDYLAVGPGTEEGHDETILRRWQTSGLLLAVTLGSAAVQLSGSAC